MRVVEEEKGKATYCPFYGRGPYSSPRLDKYSLGRHVHEDEKGRKIGQQKKKEKKEGKRRRKRKKERKEKKKKKE